MALPGREFIGCVESYHTANLVQSGREFIGFVESYHTAHCGTVWKRDYKVCGLLSHCTL